MMRLRSMLFSAVTAAIIAQAAQAQPLPPLPVPGTSRLPVIAVQVTDPRVFQMEEQVRQLNGRIEELNFMVLELQEMIRKMQKDNEFRFQELESQKQGAAPSGNAGTTDTAAANPGAGEPEKPLGTITFDAQGNPLPNPGGGAAAGQTASIPAGLGDAELFDSAYSLVLAGDYAAAESALAEHVSRFPASARTPDARYWLGEAQLGQEKYTEAAESFLAISRDYPAAERAPEALLKLGVSMAALKKNDIACATFNEVTRRYPDADGALKSRVETEKAAAQC
jgi:tol-pal system protein YbgF